MWLLLLIVVAVVLAEVLVCGLLLLMVVVAAEVLVVMTGLDLVSEAFSFLNNSIAKIFIVMGLLFVH